MDTTSTYTGNTLTQIANPFEIESPSMIAISGSRINTATSVIPAVYPYLLLRTKSIFIILRLTSITPTKLFAKRGGLSHSKAILPEALLVLRHLNRSRRSRPGKTQAPLMAD